MSSKAKLGFVTFLTFVRFPLVLLFFTGAILYAVPAYRVPWLFVATFTALLSSAVTDLLDGHFARAFGVVTQFGAHVDPLMDKFFYLASLPLLVFVAAAKQGHLTHATFLLILTLFFLARDQWVAFVRSIGSIYDVRPSAHWSAKLRAGINFPLICVAYHFEEAPPALQWVSERGLYAFEAVGLTVNFLSVVVHTRRYWPYLRRAAKPDAQG